jgi:hypothetical protein
LAQSSVLSAFFIRSLPTPRPPKNVNRELPAWQRKIDASNTFRLIRRNASPEMLTTNIHRLIRNHRNHKLERRVLVKNQPRHRPVHRRGGNQQQQRDSNRQHARINFSATVFPIHLMAISTVAINTYLL